MDREFYVGLSVALSVALAAMMILNYKLMKLLKKSIAILNEITNRKADNNEFRDC